MFGFGRVILKDGRCQTRKCARWIDVFGAFFVIADFKRCAPRRDRFLPPMLLALKDIGEPHLDHGSAISLRSQPGQSDPIMSLSFRKSAVLHLNCRGDCRGSGRGRCHISLGIDGCEERSRFLQGGCEAMFREACKRFPIASRQ